MGILLEVANLSARITADDLIVRFSEHGIVESATLDRVSSTSPERRSACVVMVDGEEAQAAIDWLDDTEFGGRTISVAKARAGRQRTFWLHLDPPS